MRLPKLKQNEIIEVVWHDTHDVGSEHTWIHRDDMREPLSSYECLSIGYFDRKESGFIYLAGDVLHNHVGRAVAIPIGCIRAIKKL